MMENAELVAWLNRPDVHARLKPVRELQKVILGMLVDIDAICQKHGLRYYLRFGTLLGAVRHGGFIPWDDDADITMPREDYEKFLEIAKLEMGEGYFVQDYRTERYGRFVFAKLRKNGTKCVPIEHEHIKMHQGIFVDIFPTDELPRSAFRAWLLWMVPRFFERLTAFTSANLPPSIRFLAPVQWVWKRFFTPSFFARLANVAAQCFSGEGDRSLMTFDPLRISIFKNSVPKNDFEPSVRLKFEGYEFVAPRGYDNMLQHYYGDYMKLPAPDDRFPVHGS